MVVGIPGHTKSECLLKQVSDRNARHFRKTWGGFAAVTEVLQSAQWQRHLTEWQRFLKQIDDRVIDDGKPQWSVEETLAEQELFAPQGVS